MKPISAFFSPRLYSQLTQFLGVIAAGDDVNTFLQGQLTNDVAALAVGAHQRTGYCTPKGRLLATMLQWRIGEHSIGHVMPADIAQATVKRLAMFVLRSKVKFSDMATAPMVVIGLWGKPVVNGDWQDGKMISLAESPTDGIDPGPWLLVDATCPVLGERAWLIGAAADKDDVLRGLSEAKEVDQEAWQFSEIMNAKPWVVQATRETFVPQMINFELIKGVSFSKGCYPGQEVVARTQYLGKLKRRMFRADIAPPIATALTPSDLIGADVWSEHHSAEPCGRVVLAAHTRDASGSRQATIALLIESTMEAWESGGLHLQSINGPAITQAALPYSFPAAA